MLDTLLPHTPHTPLCADAPPWGRAPRKSIRNRTDPGPQSWVGLEGTAPNVVSLHAGKPGER